MKSKENIRESLKKGVVTFQYLKRNGEIRTAKGTTKKDIVEGEYSFKGGYGPKTHGYISYWDVDKNDWRCFDEDKLIAVL